MTMGTVMIASEADQAWRRKITGRNLKGRDKKKKRKRRNWDCGVGTATAIPPIAQPRIC